MSDSLTLEAMDNLLLSKTQHLEHEDDWIIDWYDINTGVIEWEKQEIESEERQK